MRQLPRPVQPACPFVPPPLLRAVAERGTPDQRARALRTLRVDARLRRTRAVTPPPRRSGQTMLDPPSSARRTISDAEGSTRLPGRSVREEGGPPTADPAVDEAYDGLGATWDFFADVLSRDSLDGRGLPLLATVHYGRDYDNAFWDGERMVFGDGDGELFGRFTASLDVIAHELTHGMTEVEAGLTYEGQSGALNESVSDVFGSLVRQWHLGQTADQADWLIGADLLRPGVEGVALRSMAAPGTAYDDDVLGKDPQPATMSGYVETSDDNGGVHLNSGIPNHAFYVLATALGGQAWEVAGRVWYAALRDERLQPGCDFATFAGLTVAAAASLAAPDGAGQAQDGVTDHVRAAWRAVEVVPEEPVWTTSPDPSTPGPSSPDPSTPAPPSPDPSSPGRSSPGRSAPDPPGPRPPGPLRR